MQKKKIGHQAEAYLQTNQTLIQYNGLFLSGFQWHKDRSLTNDEILAV